MPNRIQLRHGVLVFESLSCSIYILQYAYLIPAFALVMCFITGIFFSVALLTCINA